MDQVGLEVHQEKLHDRKRSSLRAGTSRENRKVCTREELEVVDQGKISRILVCQLGQAVFGNTKVICSDAQILGSLPRFVCLPNAMSIGNT